MATELIIDASTGEIVTRELTSEEIAEIQDSPEIVVEKKRHEIELLRRGAYASEADPLFFGWQRGENTEQAWLDKVAEIRARYPYPA
jgi:hypothetical protein